jgi:VanZ family protein
MKRTLTYWLPPILWATVILMASTDAFSSPNTGGVLERIAIWLIGHPLAPATLDTLNFIVRKCAHLTEYGILGALTFRAVRGARPSWSLRWAVIAVLIAAGVASADEIHQTFTTLRTGTWHDVVLDTAGAALAQFLIRAAQVLLFRPS